MEYIRRAIREKNWQKLIALVMNLMAEAEEKFDNGADRRTWVLGAVQASADVIDYDIDIEQVGELVDALCALSKKVNFSKKEVIE